MAIKGLGYTKTTWAYGERPVSSAKLNAWDDRIEAALEAVHFLLSLAWGGGDGVIRGAEGELRVEATDPPGLSVKVAPGWAFIGGSPYRMAEAVATVDLPVPQSADRVDLVQARLDSWNVTVKQGVEGGAPAAPEADADCIALAEVFLRPGAAAVRDTDNGVDGYVVDRRRFL